MAVTKKIDGGAKGGGFAVGGTTGSPAQNGAGPQKAGSTVGGQPGSSPGMKASGGSAHMAPHSGAGKLKAGDTANPMNGGTGGWATGGSGKMHTNTGSLRAVPGKTSAC